MCECVKSEYWIQWKSKLHTYACAQCTYKFHLRRKEFRYETKKEREREYCNRKTRTKEFRICAIYQIGSENILNVRRWQLQMWFPCFSFTIPRSLSLSLCVWLFFSSSFFSSPVLLYFITIIVTIAIAFASSSVRSLVCTFPALFPFSFLLLLVLYAPFDPCINTENERMNELTFTNVHTSIYIK